MSELENKDYPQQDDYVTGESGGDAQVLTETQKPKNTVKAEIYDWLEIIVTAVLACVLIFVFFARTIGVIGSSMERTLSGDDRVIISNLFYTPEYGDIVVLRKQSFMEEPVIKRVIATEGQTLEIDFDEGTVYVDGVALIEDYTAARTHIVDDYSGPVTVPEGHVYVMGDNRNESRDSRDRDLGVVDNRYIMGRVLLRVWPFDKIGTVD